MYINIINYCFFEQQWTKATEIIQVNILLIALIIKNLAYMSLI